MDLNKQKTILLRIRAEYTDLLDGLSHTERSERLNDEGAVDSDIPTHDADIATETYERERDAAFVTDYESVLKTIDRALAKIEEGTYGWCDKCDKQIPESRLEAQPYAVLCIEDQELADEGI